MKRNSNRLLAALLAGLFVLQGVLTSSDFPRGLYCPPYIHNNGQAAWWDSIALLHPNQVWNWGRDWYQMGPTGMNTFFQRAHDKGLKVVLRNGDYSYTDSTYTDSVPFWIEYYSGGQYNIYEADWTWDYSHPKLEAGLAEYFYHFWHSVNSTDSIGQSVEIGGVRAWKCTNATDSAGVMLFGPCETNISQGTKGGFWDQTDWPRYPEGDRWFRTIVKVRANTAQLSSNSDSVFRLEILNDDTNVTLDTTIIGEDLANLTWTELEFDYLVLAEYDRTNYRMTWYDNCDFWVDWIKYMDMERAYYLFYESSPGVFAFRDSILDSVILPQCNAIEQAHGADMAAWMQVDEPRRCAFRAMGVVNDTGQAHLQLPPWAPLKQDYYSRRPKLLVVLGRPPLINTDPYVFVGTGSTGDQSELDKLALELEDAYQACQIDADSSIALHFTGQAFAEQRGGVWFYRNPTRSEILAESFMALAHGAQGIHFFRYRELWPGADTVISLVDLNYSHVAEKYADKWQAVHDVFAQLDSIGDTLLLLDRVGAYLAREANGNFAPSLSLDSVYFEEESRDSAWIEVGQFQDASDNEYLILVNRRTNADRHITVKTSLSGTWATRDLYTQERFLSSTGDFYSIPFDSGEGRVFKLNAY